MAQDITLSASGKLIGPDGVAVDVTLDDIVVDDATFDDITVDALTTGNVATTGTNTITSASASALTVGRLGATTPALQVDASTATSVTGVKVKSAAAAAGVAVSAVSSGTDESLTIDAKGAGVVKIGGISTGGVSLGLIASTELAVIKGVYHSGTVAVTVPTLAAETSDSVAVDVASAFTPSIAVGDLVFAIPTAALPTDCLLGSAYVTATDTVTVTFDAKEGGGVTGAAVNFKFLVVKLV